MKWFFLIINIDLRNKTFERNILFMNITFSLYYQFYVVSLVFFFFFHLIIFMREHILYRSSLEYPVRETS
jgi:hypothetical protein